MKMQREKWSTRTWRERAFEKLIAVIGDIDVADFTYCDVEDFEAAMFADGLGANSVRSYLKAVSPVLKFAVRRGWRDGDPFGGYKYPRSYMRAGSGTTNPAATYEQGAIIMDVWDTKTDEVVWRGVAWKILNSNPEKRGKQLDKAMESMWRKWETIKRKRKPKN